VFVEALYELDAEASRPQDGQSEKSLNPRACLDALHMGDLLVRWDDNPSVKPKRLLFQLDKHNHLLVWKRDSKDKKNAGECA
jgi:hypothetical protein